MSRKDSLDNNSLKKTSNKKTYKIVRDFNKNRFEVQKIPTSRTRKEFFKDAGIIVFVSVLISLFLAILFGFENQSIQATASSYAFFIGALMLIFASLSGLASESPTIQSMNNYFTSALLFISNPFAGRNQVKEQLEKTEQQSKDPKKQKLMNEPGNDLNIHRNENVGLYVFSGFMILIVAFII